MSDQTNKDPKRDQRGVPAAPPEAPQPVDSDDGVSALPSGAPAAEDRQTQQGTGCDDANGHHGARENRPEDAGNGDRSDSTPDAQDEGDGVLSGRGQTEQKPVSADGKDTAQDPVIPEEDQPSIVTEESEEGKEEESEEEKEAVARAMHSYDEAIGRGDIREPWDDPDIAEPEPDSTIWPEYKEYEPPATHDLIRRAGQIHVARVEWRGFRPTLTVVSDRYATPSMPSAVYKSVRLASEVADYQSAREVFNAVYDVLQNCSALFKPQSELLTFWSIASWFQDSLDFLPRITVSGPRYAADLLFTLLTYVCRRAIKLIDISAAVLEAISIEQLRPTLLIHQVNATKSATQVLNATDYPGYIIAGARELRQHCCAKVLYIGETCNPKQSMSGLHIHLGRNAPVPMRPYLTSAAVEQLQGRLLAYRSFNRERIDFLEVSPGELQPEFDVIARRLGAVIVNDPALQLRLIELLKGWSEETRAERASGIEATVLTAVLTLAHGNDPQAYVREITAVANQLRIEQGEASKLSNEKIGHALRKLGLHTRRDMKGRGLVFDRSTQLFVHELCLEYDVLPTPPECGYCHKLQTPEWD